MYYYIKVIKSNREKYRNSHIKHYIKLKGVSYIINEKIKKGVCQCRKCNNVFDQTKIEHIHREQLGQQSIDRICPYCGSTNFGLMDYPILEKHLIYKSKNFFKKDKNNKNIRHYNISDFIEEDYE